MNQAFYITLGQFLAFIALGIGVSFGLFFCIEAIVAWFRRWVKWREARRLVRQAEATETMKRYRAGQIVVAVDHAPNGDKAIETRARYRADGGIDILSVREITSGTKEAEVLREMQQLNDLMGGKK